MKSPNPVAGGLVLVVDDDLRNAKLLTRILEAEGFRTRVAPDGETALALAAAQPPDMILLDVMMPGLDGYSVCSRLRADPPTRSIPVLLVTALTATEDKVRGLDAGADDFITKPVNRAELLARVRTHFRIKSLRDELEEKSRLLEERNQQLLALEKLREDLTHMVAHDLKSPLSAIQLNVDLLRSFSESSSPRAERTLAGISEASSRVAALVQNMLDVARLEEAEIAPRLSRFSMDAMLTALGGSVAASLGGSPERLHMHIEPSVGEVVADPEMLSRILENLISNAVKAAGRESEMVLLVQPLDGGGAVVSVGDRGPGVPEELRQRIFDKFSSVEAAKQGLSANHGLGLTFCRLAVEAHGGRIWVEPREGGGSWFRFTLPEQEPAPQERVGQDHLEALEVGA